MLESDSKQFSSVLLSPLIDGVVEGDTRDNPAEIPFQSFLQEALVSSSGVGRDVFDVVHTAFALPTTALPTLQGARKDDFG